MSIREIVPDPEDLLALDVSELAGVLLEHLNSFDNYSQLHHYNFFNGLRTDPPYQQPDKRIDEALMEAWDWLLAEGFLAKRGDDSSRAGTFITRRGRRLKSRNEFESYCKASLLPRGHLHPLIANEVFPAFLRGKYDTAIFEAFREVEVEVRNAGGFQATDIGVPLMRNAFKPSGNPAVAGPLTDASLPVAEQEAMMSLFAGAIGMYKNPQSHRHDPTEGQDAAEVIVFASQLLRIVDRLKAQKSLTP